MIKKVLVLLFVICAILFTVACAEDLPGAYLSDFSKGLDGWTTNNDSVLSVKKDGSLLIEHRSTELPDAVRDYTLISGMRYCISLDVCLDTGKEADFLFGVFCSGQGKNWLGQKLKKGKWQTVKYDFAVDFYACEKEHTGLLFTIDSDSPVKYQIRNFNIQPMNWLVEGIKHETHLYAWAGDGYYGVKAGDIFSDEYLSVLVTEATMYADGESVRILITPLKSGISRLKGHTWYVLPKEEMPEELLGAWKYIDKNNKNDEEYYIFHENGVVTLSRSTLAGYDNRETRYAYSCGMVAITSGYFTYFSHYSRFFAENGILIPANSRELKEPPKKLAEGKIPHLKKAAIDYFDPGMENPGMILADPTGETSGEMIIPVASKRAKQKGPADCSLKYNISDPEALEAAGQNGSYIFLRGKKAGTVDVSVQPDDPKGEESNTLTFTVAEGEKTLPDQLVGVRWTSGKYSIVFNQNGEYVFIAEVPEWSRLDACSGHYLYYDGLIQIGSDNNNYNQFRPCYPWFRVLESNGETELYCYGSYSGVWHSEPLQVGISKSESGTFLFTEDGIPAKDDMTWDELWLYYRKSRNIDPIQ